MSRMLIPWQLILACSILGAAASGVQAQETPSIKWRSEYSVARKESEAKNLPLLIYFTRPACVYCDKMEASTYRDTRMITALNDKAIPLKINGQEQPQWVAKLNVNAFPTLILARPDGHYETMVGYQETEILLEKIQRVHALLTPPETMQRDYESALKWEAAGEYARAIAALKNMLDDGQTRPLQKSAQELLRKIEQRAEESLARAKEFQDKGKNLEALNVLTETIRQYPGLKTSNLASDMIGKLVQANSQLRVDHRNKKAQELLTQAEAFYKSNDYIPCLDRCELLVSNYGDLPEGTKGFKLASDIKNNPEWMQGAAAVMTDRLGGILLALADGYLKSNEVRKAQETLQRVVQMFPGSRFAESAQIRLTQLQTVTPPGTLNARP